MQTDWRNSSTRIDGRLVLLNLGAVFVSEVLLALARVDEREVVDHLLRHGAEADEALGSLAGLRRVVESKLLFDFGRTGFAAAVAATDPRPQAGNFVGKVW